MFDDTGDKDGKKPSLLSRGAVASRSASRGGSLLAMPATSADADPVDELDPVARHRLARSRREAAPSPLLAALARIEGVRVGGDSAETAGEPAAEPKASRWNLRDLLSSKLKYDPPEQQRPQPPQPVPDAASAEARAAGRMSGEDSAPSRSAASAARPAETPAWERTAETPASRSNPRDVRPEKPVSDFLGDEFDPSVRLPDDATSGGPVWRPLIDPMRVIGGIFNSKTLIVAATVIGGMIGVAIALSTPKKYEAFSEMLVDPRDLKVSDRDLTQTGLTSDALLALVENQVRLMTSGTVLIKVADKLKLEDDPEFNGQRKAGGIGNFIASLRALLSRNGGAAGDDNRRVVAVENLARALTVERSGKTFIVTVSAKTEDPEKSARIVNTLDEVFLQASGDLQSDTAGRAADELTSRLEELRSSVEAAERKVEKFRAENDLIDTQGRLISDDELVKLNEQLSITRAQTLELNARAQSVRSVKADSVIGGGMPEEVTSPVMSELRSQYATIKQEADRLSVRLGPRHPQYLALQAQLQGAREQIDNELRRIVATVQTQLKRSVQLEQDLAARLAQLKIRSGDVNGSLVTLRELEREAAAKRAVYENYLLRAREAGEQRGINTANISVISQAFPPLDPTGPSRSTIAMTGAFVGFFAGIALGMARGIFWSLRDRARARRAQSRPKAEPAPPAMFGASAQRRATPAPSPITPVTSPENAAETSGENSAVNPLARLIERMRSPLGRGSKPKADIDPPVTTAAAAGKHSSQDTQIETAGRDAARPSEEAEAMHPYPQPIYPEPAYPQQPAGLPQQPAAYPQQPAPFVHPAQAASYPSYPQAFAQPPQYPPAFMPQPAAYPYPAAASPQPAFHGWQPQPVMAPYGYPQPMPVGAPYPSYPQAAAQAPAYPQDARPMAAPAPEARSPREMSPIEEVRESLREFREAIRDLVEDRVRRRYS